LALSLRRRQLDAEISAESAAVGAERLAVDRDVAELTRMGFAVRLNYLGQPVGAIPVTSEAYAIAELAQQRGGVVHNAGDDVLPAPTLDQLLTDKRFAINAAYPRSGRQTGLDEFQPPPRGTISADPVTAAPSGDGRKGGRFRADQPNFGPHDDAYWGHTPITPREMLDRAGLQDYGSGRSGGWSAQDERASEEEAIGRENRVRLGLVGAGHEDELAPPDTVSRIVKARQGGPVEHRKQEVHNALFSGKVVGMNSDLDDPLMPIPRLSFDGR
jgi:hypothetical protein